MGDSRPDKSHKNAQIERESTNRAPETENAGEEWPGGGWPTVESEPTPLRTLVALGFRGSGGNIWVNACGFRFRGEGGNIWGER
jgi:hypothetical protein